MQSCLHYCESLSITVTPGLVACAAEPGDLSKMLSKYKCNSVVSKTVGNDHPIIGMHGP